MNSHFCYECAVGVNKNIRFSLRKMQRRFAAGIKHSPTRFHPGIMSHCYFDEMQSRINCWRALRLTRNILHARVVEIYSTFL